MAAHSLNSLVHRGFLGPFHCDGREILRRIFVTVRDRRWQEVAPTVWSVVIEEARRTVTLAARHVSEEVDFEWRGTLEASDDLKSVRFSFEGAARRNMHICRLGLIVLHPVGSLIGSRLTAKGPQGSQRLMVAELIHPQPIVNGTPGAMLAPFSELSVEREDFGRLDLDLNGDLFEIEDQRNWGDASFKTYCTPLRLGFPRSVKARTAIVHSVEVQFEPAPRSRHISAKTQPQPAPYRVPAIGRVWRGSSFPDIQQELNWSFVSVDLGRGDSVGRLKELLKSSPTITLQVSVEAEWDQAKSEELLALLVGHRDRVPRVLVYGAGTGLPSASLISQWRQQIDAFGAPAISLLAATRGYFVEFNRSIALDAPLSGIAFPLTATVQWDPLESTCRHASLSIL